MDTDARSQEGDEEDSHTALSLASNELIERISTLVGGRHSVAAAAANPGRLVGSIYESSSDIGTKIAVNELIKSACTLANRAIILGPSQTVDEGGTGPHTAAAAAAEGDGYGSGLGGARGAKRRRHAERTHCPIRVQINRMLETLYYVNHAVRSADVTYRLVKGIVLQEQGGGNASVEITDSDLSAGAERFTGMEAEDTNPLQNLLLFLLNQAQSDGLRRSGTDCYSRIISAGGYDTHAWRRVHSIQEFVYNSARKEVNFAQWLNLTNGSRNAASAADHLMFCHDVQFPPLVRDRHVFAFANGLYLAATDKFVPYASVSEHVGTDISACKFFDADFDDYAGVDDWMSIPTPNMDIILDHQEFSEDVKRWMFIFIGRLIYNVNEIDGWQVVPYLKGQAGSGKSSILVQVCGSLYDAADIGVLSNNVERKFGLSAFSEKLLFIAPEVKEDMQLEQAEFQSIVSGESVQVNIKYKTAQTVAWNVPGIMAGNEFPKWRDNSGSINRRVVLFAFDKRVSKGDMELAKRLRDEMPAIIKKANRGYLDAVARAGRADVWSCLPAYFAKLRKELAEDANPQMAFIDETMRTGQHTPILRFYIPFEEFTARWTTFCQKYGFPVGTLKPGTFKNIINGKGGEISSMIETKEWPYGNPDKVKVHGKFVYGMDLKVAGSGSLDPI